MKTNTIIHIDPNDLGSLIKIMDEYGNLKEMLFGENENGEKTFMSVTHESISIGTLQKNGWTRANTYYRDGSSDETFDGRWK